MKRRGFLKALAAIVPATLLGKVAVAEPKEPTKEEKVYGAARGGGKQQWPPNYQSFLDAALDRCNIPPGPGLKHYNDCLDDHEFMNEVVMSRITRFKRAMWEQADIDAVEILSRPMRFTND